MIKRYDQCKPKELKGTGGAIKAGDWIRVAERIFKAMNCTTAQKVRLTAFSMHGQGQIWWESKKRELTTPNEVFSWDVFIEEMQNKYISTVVKDKKKVQNSLIWYKALCRLLSMIQSLRNCQSMLRTLPRLNRIRH